MQKLSKLLTGPENGAAFSSQAQAGLTPAARREGLSPALAAILGEVQRELGMQLDADGSSVQPEHAEIEHAVTRAAEKMGLELSRIERDEVLGYVEKDQKPFGLLQDLVDDPGISDIIVTHHARICVQQGRRNFATDLSFASIEAYEAYVE